MLKRLGIGLLKGLVMGGALGAAIQLGLAWVPTTGLLAYLLAMGIGATTGILCGKPPWKAEAWIESVLKGVFGLGVGALLYWVTSSYLAFGMPIALPNAPVGTAWTSLPVFYGGAIGAVFGSLIELDNTDDAAASRSKKVRHEKGPRARVAANDDNDDFEVEASSGASGKKSKKA